MTYRVICEYVPSVIVNAHARRRVPLGVRPHFRRGYWRVIACAQATPASAALMRPVVLLQPMKGFPRPLLVVSSHRYRQPNSMCSPRKILAEWQHYQRQLRQFSEYERAFNEWAERGMDRRSYHSGLGGD